MSERRTTWVLLLFFLSGLTGLVYEIVWIRMLTSVFGHTIYAVSTVLTAFMAGLGLGSFLFGRRADRFANPLRAYARLELGIAACALLVPVALGALHIVFAPVYRSLHASFYAFSLIRFVFCFAILLVPTTLMGATLPVLSKTVARRFDALGRQVGVLYAVNTLGAVLGCFLTGFVALEALGIKGTIALAASVNLLLAIAAWRLSATAPSARTADPEVGVAPAPESPRAAEGAPSATTVRVLLAVFGASGFVALGLEVVWTRALVFSFFQGSSTYAFTTMLTVFLVGLGIGSLIAARLVDRARRPMRLFAWIELAIGAAALVSGPLLLRLGRAHVDDPLIVPWLHGIVRDFLRSGAVMIAPTLLMGATFPVMTRIYVTQVQNVSRGVGTLYASNTLGAILGSFAAGFVLIPFAGLSRGLLWLGSISLLLAVAVLLVDPDRGVAPRVIGCATAVGGLVVGWLLSPVNAPYHQLPAGMRLRYYEEGKNGTVSVSESGDGTRWLNIDNVSVAGNTPGMMTDQKSLAHIPALFHPDPRDVLTVGFGSGGASWSFTTHPGLEKIHCVEIAPEMVKAHTFFPDCNFSLFDDPRYEIAYDDAKSYLLLGETMYDVISTDCTDLRYKSNADLYSLDYFRTCKRRLRENGMLVVWMPLTGLDEFHYKVVLRTFSEVFSEGTLWYMNNLPTNYILLIGSDQPLELDWQKLTQRLAVPRVRHDLAMIDLADPYKLVASFLLDAKSLRDLVAGYPLNTDDKPIVEFGVPKSPASLDYMKNLEVTLRLRGTAMPPVVNIPEGSRPEIMSRLQRQMEAGRHTTEGHLHLLRSRRDSALYEYRRALKLTPGDESLRKAIGISAERERQLRAGLGATQSGIQARLELASLLRESARFQEAVEQAERFFEALPGDPAATLLLGGALERLGKLDEADARYKQYLDRGGPQGQDVRIRAALAANEMRRRIEATGDPQAVLALADLLVALDDKLEAIRVLEQHAERLDAFPLFDRLASLYLDAHVLYEAQAAAERMLALDPKRPEGHYYLMHVHLACDDLEQAEREFQSIADPKDRNGNVWLLAAVLYQRQGREGEAVEALRQALHLGGSSILRLAEAHPALAGTRVLDRARKN